MFKFHLSTILLVIALIAALLGWFVDHNSRHSINGSWRVSFTALVAGTNTLDIKTDGTFTKVQDDGNETKTISGTYSVHGDGLVQFTALKLTILTRDGESIDSNIDRAYHCRCGLDSSGRLVILERHFPSGPPSLAEISWDNLCVISVPAR